MIRIATPADEARIREIVAAAYAPYVGRIGKPPGPMVDDYAAIIAAGEAWVLDEAGQALGVIVLKEVAPATLLLDNVAIAPSAQGQGHGRTMVAFAETEARHRGCASILLYTNVKMVENLALYARLGFQETRRVSEAGYDRVYMTKQLA